MIEALEEGVKLDLSREELGLLQADMLLLGGEALQTKRSEVIAKMLVRHVVAEDSLRPDYSRQHFVLDVLGRDTYGAFRYELTNEGISRAGCELEIWQLGDRSAGIDAIKEQGTNESDSESIVGMMRRAIEVGEGSTVWPKTHNPDSDNPILGRNFGMKSIMLDPAPAVRTIGALMVAGGNMLKYCSSDRGAEVHTDLNCGKFFYGDSYQKQYVILWGRSEKADAQFSMNVSTVNGGNQCAFADVLYRLDEYGVKGKLRRTIKTISQEGDGLIMKSLVQHDGENHETKDEVPIDSIVDIANEVRALSVG